LDLVVHFWKSHWKKRKRWSEYREFCFETANLNISVYIDQ
jgi:hypothetical protein